VPASGGFSYTVERRDRTGYFSSLRNGDKENFFGAIVARDPVDQLLTLQHLAQTPSHASIEVALQGVTENAHRVKVQINGSDAGEMSFSGQNEGVATFSVPQSMLIEGQNRVTLTTQSVQTDTSLVDYVRLTYQHSYTADNNLLRLTAAGKQQVVIEGFASNQIRVMDVSNPLAVQEVIGTVQQGKSGYGVSVTVPDGSNKTLLAFTNDQARGAASLVLNKASSLGQPSNGADLLVVTRADFIPSFDVLKQLRQKQGLAVSMVDIEDVYDEFSFGQKSPQALKDFLAYARFNWKRAPHYALLAADASHDPRNYLGFGDWDLVPTKLIDTQFMETASDSWLADFDGDGIEDMAIG